jgi:hypothetical protein
VLAAIAGEGAIRPTDAQQLYGMGEVFVGDPANRGPKFGTIDPVTGGFNQIGNGTFASGYYALTFDPLTNSFFTTRTPINDNGSTTSSIMQIDAVTGNVTFRGITNSLQLGGLGVATVASVPEPATWAMLLLGFAGLGFAFRQSRKLSFA